MKQEQQEYAPQYSQRERIRYAIIGVVCFSILFAVTEWWAFPQWRMFVQTAHCRTVLGVPGIDVMLYAVLVGVPLIAVLSVAAIIVPSALRSIRARQYPPPGQKMFAKVRVRTGRSAIMMGSSALTVVALLPAIPLWGGLQAREILARANPPSDATCPAVHSESPKANASLDGEAMHKETFSAGHTR